MSRRARRGASPICRASGTTSPRRHCSGRRSSRTKRFSRHEEAAEFAARAAQREADGESRPTAQQTAGQRTGYASSIWFETTHSLSDNRTSLLVDQEDGKLPPLTPEGQKIAQQLAEGAKLRPADDPEDRGAYERCISRGLPGAMMPGFYNHNYQIVQTKDYVVISVEMIHDARIIPLDGGRSQTRPQPVAGKLARPFRR